jgi:CHAT domain-containing protein/tetratricopeptide (TPR) repeat protein
VEVNQICGKLWAAYRWPSARGIIMFMRRICLVFVVALSVAAAQAQSGPAPKALAVGEKLERELAGREEHVYNIPLAQAQLVRVRVDQRQIDAVLILASPEGKPLAEMNFTEAGESEILSIEAASAGNYSMTIRGMGGSKMRGSYRLEIVGQPTSDASRSYHAAQMLVLDANQLAKEGPAGIEQGIAKLEEAMSIWQKLGERSWTGLTLYQKGKLQMRQGRFDKAGATFEQSVTLHRELKEPLREAMSLNGFANSYYNQRQFDKAIEIFEQELAIFREQKFRRWEGLILNSIGNSNASLGRLEKAIEYFEQSRAIMHEVNDQTNEAQAMNRIGVMNLNLGRSEEAAAAFRGAIAKYKEAEDRYGEAQTLNNLAILEDRGGRSENAISLLLEARAIFRDLKDRGEETNIVLTLGTVYGGMGQTEKGIEYFNAALQLSRELKDKRREAGALNNLGLAYTFINQYEKAIEFLELCLPIARESGNRLSEASTYSYLGVAYAGLSQFEKAIESHEQSLVIYREIGDRVYQGNALQNLGSMYQFIGREDRAIENFSQALAVFREVKYRTGEANALSNRGSIFGRLGQYDEAFSSQTEALAIFRELKYRLGEGSTLMEMGVLHAAQGEPEKAVALYEQAIPILRETKEQSYVGMVLFRLAESKVMLGRLDEAAALFAESASVMRQIGNRSSESTALTSLADLEAKRGKLELARKYVEESLLIAESLRSDLVSPESRADFLATVQKTYQLYAGILMRQHQADPAKGLNVLALETSERQRARSLLDLLAESRAEVGKGVEPALITRERTLSLQLNEKAAKLTMSAVQSPELKREVSQLESDLERTQVAIRKADPRYSALTKPQPLKLKEMQAQLDGDTLQLEYALGEGRSYLWAVTRDSIVSYELPDGEQIKKSALQVYKLMTVRNSMKSGETPAQHQIRIADADAQLLTASRDLSRMILGPAAAQLAGKRLVIIPDGALQYIPFAMLPDPAGKDDAASAEYSRPLIVGHEVVSQPSASALAVQRVEFGNRQPAAKTLAVIADPVFDRSDKRFRSPAPETVAAATPKTPAADTRILEHIADGNTGKLVIRRLPFTRQEADTLLALAPKGSSWQAMNFQANRANVLGTDLSQYRYVHFATHGLLDTERPGLSSLVLSTVDPDGKPQDGFLRANDIYNMRLPAELVVLSACQTGLGKEVKGEGLIGLTRGFMYAGAKRVVVSLWSVNDKATSDLMAKFYRGMLQKSERPAAALRAAQIEMWKQKQWRSPYYWAAFTMQGEWK